MGCSASGDALQYRLEESVSTPGEWRWTTEPADLRSFLCAYSAQTVRPHQNSLTKGTSFGMSASPGNCAIWAVALLQPPPRKYPF